MSIKIDLLNSSLNKKGFKCGKEMLDNYLHTQASQDVRRKLCVVFAMFEGTIIKGYYTLSSTSIPRELIPSELEKKFPKSYQTIPATLLGRLARDKTVIGTGQGEKLLIDALYRSHLAAKEVGSFAVVVDPIDEKAESFYLDYGFKKLPDSGKLFLAMKTIDQLFG